jgi:hypothetical protein
MATEYNTKYEVPPGDGFIIKKPNGKYMRVEWRLYYPDCRRYIATCNNETAYLPAITVGIQQLY